MTVTANIVANANLARRFSALRRHARGHVVCGFAALAVGVASADDEALFVAAVAADDHREQPVDAARPDVGGLPSVRQRLVTLDARRLDPPSDMVAPATAGDGKAGGRAVDGDWRVRMNLFDDAGFEAVFEHTFPLVNGHALRGRLANRTGEVTLAVRGNTVAGTVLTPNAAFVIRPAGRGRHTVSEVDRAWFPLPEEADESRRRVPPVDAPARLFERFVDPPPGEEASADARTSDARRKNAPAPIARGHRPSGVAGFRARWLAQGPGPILWGQVENVTPNNEVVGAVHTVLAHPTNADLLYVGATNGGIWRTDDATSMRPTWRPLTDHANSLSIGAMAFDVEDVNTLIAGIGRYSSFGGAGGDRTGLLLSRDGGETWRALEDRLFPPLGNVSGVAMRGDRIVASLARWDGGAVRSADGGASWDAIPDLSLDQYVFDLVADPSDADRLYVTVEQRGVFRSDDGGATWRNVSSHDPVLTGAFTRTVRRDGRTGNNNNAELAVGADGRVFVAVLVGGQANYIGFTDDQGGSWTAMDLPLTLEVGDAVDGLNPRFKPGAQGAIHFSILVDPNDSDAVYVGGDRQNFHFVVHDDGTYSVHNSIGARDYTGRLFRGDAGIAATGEVPSPQWEHLTHRADVAAVPGGGTGRASSPHADSREMVFDANGDIIEVDDGGVYRRTSPGDNTGDWYSLNGNLQVSEMHNIAYDPVSKMLIGGNQDTGTPEQFPRGDATWTTVTTADGGDVAVDSSEAPDVSYRYSSLQFFRGFRRQAYDASGQRIDVEFPAMLLNGVSVYRLAPDFDFTQRFSLNAVDQRRAVVGSAVSVFETFDRFATLTEAAALNRSALDRASATAYGCTDNADLLYFGHGSAYTLARQISVRQSLGEDGAPSADDLQATGYVGGRPRDIVIDQEDCATVYAIDDLRVFVSNDTGASWRDITGNLADAPVAYPDLRKLELVPSGGLFGIDNALVIGSRAGVHVMFPRAEGVWFSMNEGLPHAPVWDLDYSAEHDALFAATLGRGAWRLQPGPVVAARIEDQALEVATGAVAVELSGAFEDAGGGALSYSASSDNPLVATVAVADGEVVVTPVAAGTATVRVVATNAAGLEGITSFTVTVGVVVDLPATAVVREGDRLYLPVRLSGPMRRLVGLRYVVTGDDNPNTADASPDDYIAAGAVILPGGARQSTLYLPIVDDGLIEPPRETFKIMLLAPTPNPDFGLGRQRATTVTIREGVCDRSVAVRDAIRAGRDCADVAEVVTITELNLSGLDIHWLRSMDFAGMSALRRLNLSSNQLASLPEGIFRGLTGVLVLSLADNNLARLPLTTFWHTPALTNLSLSRNRLGALSPFALLGNPRLTTLELDDNQLQELAPQLFAWQNGFRRLALGGNQLETLPDGLFAGLPYVDYLDLDGNPGAPFTFALDLARTDADAAAPGPADVALAVRQGAPFDIAAPVAVAGGVLGGNDTAEDVVATLRTGQQVGQPFAVRQVNEQTATVRIAEVPAVPVGVCELAACYLGVALGEGEPLVLFQSEQ